MAKDLKLPVHREQVSPAPLKRYYRPDEVAVYFAISTRSVYRLLDDGDLQGTWIRKCLRVSAEEIKRFEDALGEEAPF